MAIIVDVLPASIFDVFSETIYDTIQNPSKSLLSFGAIMMLYYASNGILSIIAAFNATYHHIDSRNVISKRLISIALTLIICTLILCAMTLMMGGSKYIEIMSRYHSFANDSKVWYVGMHIIKWILILALYFFAISFLYYLAPSKKSRFKFISPGAILATAVQMICTSGFMLYVNNFANYNKLYGSLGTIIIVLMLLYFTAISLILGFELNISILSGKEEDEKKKDEEQRRFKRIHNLINKNNQ